MTNLIKRHRPLAVAGLSFLILIMAGCHTNPQKQKLEFVASGDKYMAAHDIQNAIIEYRRALKIEPHSAETQYKLGQAYFANRQSREAFLAYRKATESNPDYLPARLALGQFSLLGGHFDDAMTTAQAILQKDPGNKEAQILLADAYAGKKNLPEGTKALEKLVQQYADYVPGYLNLGLFYLAQGKPEAAKGQFEKAVTIDPKSVEARKAMAAYYALNKDLTKAEQEYRAAVDTNPDSVEARQMLASFYAGQGRFSEAEPLYKDIVRLQKNSAESRFSLGNFYLNQGRTDDARKIDTEISKDSPSFMLARLQLAELDLREHKYDLADQVLGQILKDSPKQYQALILAAQVSLNRKDPQKAIQQLETAEKYEPNLPVLHYWKGIAYLGQDNLDRAQSSFERAIGIKPQNAADIAIQYEAQLKLAGLMLDKGLPDAAVAHAQKAMQDAPNLPQAHLLAGRAYYDLRNFTEAEKAFQKYAELQPDSPQGPLRLGAVHFMQRRYDIAQKEFEKSLALNPKQTDALNGVVTVYRAKGQNDKAIERIRQQIAQVETADIYNLLAKTYLDLGQTEPAEKSLKRALELDPQNYNTCALFGALYLRQHSLDKAVAEFEAALRVNPRQVGAWTVLGMIEKERGDFDKAKHAYQKALEIDPNAGIAANNLAWLYCEQGGDLDVALDLARRARQAFPKSSMVSDTLGWIYCKRQLYDSAIPLLEEAVRDEPKNGEFRFHLAASLLGAGKKDQGRSELNAALKLDANLRKRQDVQKALGQL